MSNPPLILMVATYFFIIPNGSGLSYGIVLESCYSTNLIFNS